MSFNIASDGSPTPRKGPTRFPVPGDLKIDTSPEALGQAVGNLSLGGYPYALQRVFGSALTSNTQGFKRSLGPSALGNRPLLEPHNPLDGYKKSSTEADEDRAIVDSMLQRFNRHSPLHDPYSSSSGSVSLTPATEDFTSTPPTEMENSVVLVEAVELQKLKLELQEARNEVNRVNQEMHSQNVARSTMEHLTQSSEPDYGYSDDVTEQTLATLQNKFNASTQGTYGWGNGSARPAHVGSNGFGAPYPTQAQIQTRSQPSQSSYRRTGYLNEPTHFPLDQSFRSTSRASNVSNVMNSGMSNSVYTGSSNGMGVGMGVSNNLSNPPTRPSSAFDPGYNQYALPPMYPIGHPTPIGTISSNLSADANEFNFTNNMGSSPWNTQAQPETGTTQYVPPVEPMNYRRLLDRNMSCNWKYIVDKIICNNDQQASIFLQQKLKVGTPEQKYEIVEAIISQAYALMINRFGNFLVQRCFEHGTHDQVIAIAQAIRGNTLALSMDAFGCHVIQKAFDCVPEEYKATMVHELLRRIPETVIHRYACHVWQKLFELRWSDSPPQIMRYVNEALRGMWHEVALGETGSLVVQNIFENCLEEDKRPCINEVLASIDVIAHGQFGNWCIQHICEHGAPADRSRAIEHILRFSTEYSMDQYASKVIEKCLKIGGSEFLDRYLDRVCEARPDRPRMPLIDIAGDQFGNYLIQYILTNSSSQHRELVGGHIRKHMVSLRGSKYGSRVAMLCCNPALTTRPGPPAGMLPRYGNPTSRPTFGSFR
ncbi:hypothetical protein COCMIDRAFT_26132 [Bipolaris oryzae ATCC 44560]|uniref:PUM-HD domain-containing protein n=1 Tax=Bipolaris oryzae ATCC 44560 TaxID=930090 RepID=W6ZPY5_COCMI|nr:uncharacterized protein COCMIDRAFT_26132 [Bipolaris oryzae ATCC 44560]EUC45676.1 hypothetical protein COCMIDRAFT_26132 [Bipolaris oryzae ATCC 44560]